MRSLQEIKDMLALFDDADESGELDCDGEATRECLLWVLEKRQDDDLTQLLPEDEGDGTEGDEDEEDGD